MSNDHKEDWQTNLPLDAISVILDEVYDAP